MKNIRLYKNIDDEYLLTHSSGQSVMIYSPSDNIGQYIPFNTWEYRNKED